MVIPKINSAHGPDTRNIINAAIDLINAQGKSIQDLVAEGQLTPTQYAQLVSIVNGNVKKGSITTADIDKNSFLVDQTMISNELKQQIAGTAEINAVPADNSLTTNKFVGNSVTPEKTSFLSVKKLNLFNKDDPGNSENGFAVKATGLVPLANYFATHHIPLEEGKIYERPTVDTVFIFDENGEYLTAIASHEGNTFKAQKGWATVRLNFRVERKEVSMFGEAPLSTTYQPYNTLEVKSEAIEELIRSTETKIVDGEQLESGSVPWNKLDPATIPEAIAESPAYDTFGVWNVLGDSLTDAGNTASTVKYSDLVSEWLGGTTVNNYGISGSCVGTHTSIDFTAPMSERYTTMSDADIVTVFGGVNDYGKGMPLGEMADRENTTFYGALHVLLGGLIVKYTSKKIGYIIFHKFGAGWPPIQNELGFTPKQYVDAIKEVCSYYSIPTLNLFEESGLYLIDPKQKTHYSTDGLHLNDTGHEYIAKLIYKWINNRI